MEIDKTLKELVIEEAINLREYATPEELDKLDFNSLSPDEFSKCIYGQMTGNCSTDRAIELIELSCERVYSYGKTNSRDTTIDAQLNGKPQGRDGHRLTYYSPIELFIMRSEDNEPLVQFLKGEITEQEFKERI